VRNVAVVVRGNAYLQALPSSEHQADRLAAAILPEALAALGR
jgi:hypothetical protein